MNGDGKPGLPNLTSAISPETVLGKLAVMS